MKRVKFPAAKQEQDADDFPACHPQSYEPFVIDRPGVYVLLSDVHVPYQDRVTVEASVRAAKKLGAKGFIFDGDLLDCHEMSDHDKDPGVPRYVEELKIARQLLQWVRQQLPKAEMVYKEGNHEERVTRYVTRNAPALSGLEETTLPHLLKLRDAGVQWVGDRRVIHLGKLNVLHGHEYGPGGGGLQPAAWLYRKTDDVAICGHFHRISEFSKNNVRHKQRAAWTTGCACYLHPLYRRLNDWQHGYAVVEVASDGTFSVENRRVM